MQSALKRLNDGWSVALSNEAAEAAGLYEGAAVDVTVEGRNIVIRRHKVTLQEMLLDMEGRESPPMEWNDVEPRGTEFW